MFKDDFIRLKGKKMCNNDEVQFMRNFAFPSSDFHNETVALNECENYCSTEYGCWGCSLDCEKGCRWIATSECTEPQNSIDQIDTTVSRRPGKHGDDRMFEIS